MWERLGEKAGPGRRSLIINKLIEGYLDGRFVVEDDSAPQPD